MTETGWHDEFEIHPIYVYNIKRESILVNDQKRLCLVIDYDMDNDQGDAPAQEL